MEKSKTTPTCILYPRFPANIRRVTSKTKKGLTERIRKFEESKAFKEYTENRAKLEEAIASEPRFVCWRCEYTDKTKNMPLYRFISYSNTMDNDRYEDHNLVCPKCNAFSYLKDAHSAHYHLFNKVEDVYE